MPSWDDRSDPQSAGALFRCAAELCVGIHADVCRLSDHVLSVQLGGAAMIAVIDFDVGNLAAVTNMLHRVGANSTITNDPDVIAQAEKLILPGNGAFDACMRNLRSTGLI